MLYDALHALKCKNFIFLRVFALKCRNFLFWKVFAVFWTVKSQKAYFAYLQKLC